MKDYEPPTTTETEVTVKRKPTKDPNAPKRFMSSYMFFSNEVRALVKEENPDVTFGQIVSPRKDSTPSSSVQLTTFCFYCMVQGKIIGEKFRALSAEEKKKYEKLAADDKERYNREMIEYEAKKKTEAEDGDTNKDGSTST